MIRPISEGDAWVTNEDGDIIGIQLHGRSEVVDLSNPLNGKVDPVTGGIKVSTGGYLVTASESTGVANVMQPDGLPIPASLPAVVKASPVALYSLTSVPDNIAKAAPFGGWGAQYNTVSGIRFSHMLIDSLSQTAASGAEKWSRIDLQVRNINRNGAIVAYGSVFVGGYVNTLNGVVAKLYDAAGNEKVVTSADIGATYWVEARAYNKNGDICPCGVSTGLSPNYVDGSTAYFLTTTKVWTNSTGSPRRPGFQPAYYSALSALPSVKAPVPDLLLPPIYAIVGREANVYFSGLSSIQPGAVDWDVTYTGNGAIQQNDRFSVVPDAAGTFTLTIAAIDQITGATLASATTSVYVAAAAATVTPTLLAIGDSTTAHGVVTGELVTIDTADTNMSLTLIGTKGTNPNKYEATSGWATAQFVGASSPFYIGGVVDVSAYLTNNSLATPTHVKINLGINDAFAATTDAAAVLAARTAVANIAKLIAAIQVAAPTAKIGVALTTAPSDNQDAFGNTNNYATGQTQRRYKRNWAILCRAVFDAFGGQTSRLVWLLPYNVTLDTARNMQVATAASNSRNSATVTRQANGVHPDTSGYGQVADVAYAWMKNNP